MNGGEFSPLIKLDRLPAGPVILEASAEECAALAERFELPSIEALSAQVRLERVGEAVEARGRIAASFRQRCAVSDEPFPNTMDEPFAVRFVPALAALDEDEEGEFDADEPDEIAFTDNAFDLGEAVAESFALAIDRYARGPEAEAARREAGLSDEDTASGPFAALAALRGKDAG